MKDGQVIYSDTVGDSNRRGTLRLDDLDIPEVLQEVLSEHYGPSLRLSPPQEEAVAKGILRGPSDFLISAPTNSGKTLPALLRMFTAAIETGSRSVYVVPLKALAEERVNELRRIAAGILERGGPAVKIAITTGDYQLTNDFLGSPPPRKGEIVICTPERLEVILRNPKHHAWARAISTYVLDEFHLLGDEQRGATFEALTARLLGTAAASSLIALSATIGGLEYIKTWLAANGRDLIALTSSYRYPRLRREVVLVSDKQAFTQQFVQEIAEDEDRRLLIFVYRRSDAEKLARELRAQHENLELRYFHAGVSLADRATHAEAFRHGEVKVLIATTSLKMGVNFPVTDVLVRDVKFFRRGRGPLQTTDILQMMGRAGRENTPGRGVVLCEDLNRASYYADHLRTGSLEEITPQLAAKAPIRRRRTTGPEPVELDSLRSLVLTELSIKKKASIAEVAAFAARTYSASRSAIATDDLRQRFAFLHTGKLIYKEEGADDLYGITKLGRTVSLSGLSPETGSILAGFLRALIRLDQKRREENPESTAPGYLRRLTAMDFLFLSLCALEVRPAWPSNISKQGIGEVQQYIESLPVDQKPFINLWRSETNEQFPTRRLLATLRIEFGRKGTTLPEKVFYRIMQAAVLLHRHARGAPLAALSKEFGITEGDLEAKLKFTVTWILSGLAQICDSRKCYKLDPLKMKAYRLLQSLSAGTELGELMAVRGIGKKTIQKLVDSGFASLHDLRRVTSGDLVRLGITRKRAEMLVRFSRRKLR